MSPDQVEKNPIIEYCHGKPIRKYNFIIFRADPATYKQLLEIQFSTGLSSRQIIGYSSMPCKCCNETFVNVYTDQHGEVKIKRGFLSKRIPVGSGTGKNIFSDEKSDSTGAPDQP